MSSSVDEPPIVQIKWDNYNTSLFLRKLLRETEKKKVPSTLVLTPGSLDLLVILGILGQHLDLDVGPLALAIVLYLRKRRDKVKNLPPPVFNNQFLIEQAKGYIEQNAGIRNPKLISFENMGDNLVEIIFVDRKGRMYRLILNRLSGEIMKYSNDQ